MHQQWDVPPMIFDVSIRTISLIAKLSKSTLSEVMHVNDLSRAGVTFETQAADAAEGELSLRPAGR